MDTNKLEKMIKEEEIEYPLSNKDNIERMENNILVLKKHVEDLREMKDKETNFYMRKRYQSIIDFNISMINFFAIQTLGD